MKQFVLAVITAIALSACQPTTLVRVPIQEAPESPPKIDQVVDLGSWSVASEGILSQEQQDEVFIAGEWVAITGRGLNTQHSRIFLDDTELEAQGGLKGGGLLLRLPPNVLYHHNYKLRVENPLGKDETSLPVSNFIVMSDVRSNKAFFWRSLWDEDEVFTEQPFTIDCLRAGPFAVSPSGGILYLTAQRSKNDTDERFSYELKSVHLGAKQGPSEIASIPFEIENIPVSMAISKDGSNGYLLTGNELLVFDLSSPDNPFVISRHFLSDLADKTKPNFRSLVLLGNDTMGAVLDESTNKVLLVDLSEPGELSVLGNYPVAGLGGGQGVDLVADRSNAQIFWVLTGLNAHNVGMHLSNLWADEPVDLPSTRAALVQVELLDETLMPREQIFLPDGAMPLGLFSETNGDVLVSAVAYDKKSIADADFSFRGVANFLKGLRNSLFAGRIYRVTPRGDVTTEVSSINLLLSMSRLENSPLVFSTYKFSMSYFLPSVRLVLGVDVLKQQGLEVRKMDWKTLLPPYRFYPEILLL